MSRRTYIELADDDDQTIVFDAPYAFNTLIKEVGGTWNKTDARWEIPASWAACVRARGVFGDTLRVGPRLIEWAKEQRDSIENQNAIRDLEVPRSTIGYDPRLYPHQMAGADFLFNSPSALLADQPGVGKSATLLTALSKTTATPAIVICPASIKENWKREAEMWAPEVNPYIVGGGAVSRTKILAKAAEDPKALVIINFESVRSHSRLAPYGSVALTSCDECTPGGTPNLAASKCEKHPKELNKIPFETVIIDESHRLADPKSKQTRAVWAIAHAPNIKYRWAATGTPITNNPGDLWAILRAINPLSFPSKTKFIDRYCLVEHNPFGGIEIMGLKPDTSKEFFSIFDPMFRRMTKERVLKDLPPKIRTIRYAEMSTKQKKAYKEMESGFTAQLGDDWVTANDHLTAAGRLVQLSSSFAEITKPDESPDDPSTWTVKLTEPSNKVDAFMEIVEDFGPDYPLVACAESRQLIELTSARLTKQGIPHVLITGTQTQEQRTKALDDFQNGKVNILLFTIKAGGVGLTMTRADTIVFLQRSWSMVDNLQAEDRCFASGTPVLTPTGWVSIDNLSVGDKVVSHTGQHKRITDVWSQQSKQMMAELNITGQESVTCTADHRFLLRNGEWVEAQNLRPGDWLAMPGNNEESDLKVLQFDGDRVPDTFINSWGQPQRNGRVKHAPEVIDVSDDFLYTLGFFMGDGHVSPEDRYSSRIVGFCGNNDTKLEALNRCARWIESVGAQPSWYRSKVSNSLELRMHSSEWASWFGKHFGRGSRNKHMPEFLLSLNQRQSQIVLDGLTDSDGYKRGGDTRVEYTTSSRTLAANVVQLATRAGHRPSLRKGATDTLVVGYGGSEGPKTAGRVSSVLLRHAKKTNGVRERVYDITVEDDHSFVVGTVVAHNCHRVGSERHESVQIIDIVAPDTIELHQINRVHEKIEMAQEIVRD